MKIDERHSGPMILGSIIKNPPNHPETANIYRLLGIREWHARCDLEWHESVRYPNPKSSKLIFDY